MGSFQAPGATIEAEGRPNTSPLVVLYEKDDGIAVPLLSELRVAGYDVRAARTPVELFDLLRKHVVALVLVDLGLATAGRREFWVALDQQRRGRALQVMTYRCITPASPLDPEFDPAARALADLDIHGPQDLPRLVAAVRQRVPIVGGRVMLPGAGFAAGGQPSFSGPPSYAPAPYGQPSYGPPPYGQPPYGQPPSYGQPSYGPPSFAASPGGAPGFPQPAPPYGGMGALGAAPGFAPPFPGAMPPQHGYYPPSPSVAFSEPQSPFANPASSNPFAAPASSDSAAYSPFAQPYAINPFAGESNPPGHEPFGASPPHPFGPPQPNQFGASPPPTWDSAASPHSANDAAAYGFSASPGAGNGYASHDYAGHDYAADEPRAGSAPFDDAWFPPDGGQQPAPSAPSYQPISTLASERAADIDGGGGWSDRDAAANGWDAPPAPRLPRRETVRTQPTFGQGPTAPVGIASNLPMVRSQTEQALSSVLIEGALLTPGKVEVLKGIQQMLSSVDMHFKLGELALLFRFLSPDQLLAALLVSRGLVSPQQIAGLGRVKQELAASGMDHDLEGLLVMFNILPADQLRQLRAELS